MLLRGMSWYEGLRPFRPLPPPATEVRTRPLWSIRRPGRELAAP